MYMCRGKKRVPATGTENSGGMKEYTRTVDVGSVKGTEESGMNRTGMFGFGIQLQRDRVGKERGVEGYSWCREVFFFFFAPGRIR